MSDNVFDIRKKSPQVYQPPYKKICLLIEPAYLMYGILIVYISLTHQPATAAEVETHTYIVTANNSNKYKDYNINKNSNNLSDPEQQQLHIDAIHKQTKNFHVDLLSFSPVLCIFSCLYLSISSLVVFVVVFIRLVVVYYS